MYRGDRMETVNKKLVNNFNKAIIPIITMVGPVTFWLLLFVLIPLIYVLGISFMEKGVYGGVEASFTLANYKALFDPLYLNIFLRSLIIAAATTFLCLIIGYPFAYFISKRSPMTRVILLMLVIVPFWTNSLIRTYGWIIILRTEGLLNQVLMTLHIINEPLKIMYTNIAVMIGMVYTLFPFMVLPLYSSIEKLDKSLLEAANDLGAKPRNSFLKVTLPLTKSGIFAGSILVFIPTLGYFFIPDLLGGSKIMLIGNLIKNQFLTARNWPLGAALSMVLIVLTIVLVGIYSKTGGDMEDIGRGF